jgi:type IV pilus assembly protein PilC
MKFKYKEQNKNGQIIEGFKEALDKFSIAREIREGGGVPLSIIEFKEGGKFSFKGFDIFNHISLSEKIVFTNNLSGMLTAGLSLTRALTVFEKQSTNKGMLGVLRVLIDEINKGGTLSLGMKKFPKVFSAVFVSMVHSGEESGGLPRVLSEIGVNLKKTYDLNKKIKGAMIYPSVIIGVIIIIGVLMMIYVVPTLTATFKDLGTELPSSTKFIIWLSDSLSENLLLFILGLLFIVVAFVFFTRLKATRRYFDFIVLRIPMIGTLIKETNSARTTRTLSSLLSSGVDMSRALAITEDVLSNSYYKSIIHDSISSIEKGVPLSKTFKDNIHLYPVMVGEMIEVGEETGKLAQMLIDIAVFYENEVDDKTKNLSAIIEPVLMIFIGGAVGFFAVSMITPMYSVMDNIK